MKNVLKAFSVIALVAVIGFSMAACGDDDDGGGGTRWWAWDSTLANGSYDSKSKVAITPTSNDTGCDVSVTGNANGNGYNWASQVGYDYTATVGKEYKVSWKWAANENSFKNVTIRYAQQNDFQNDSAYQLGTDTYKLTIPVSEETKEYEFTMPANCRLNFTFQVGEDIGSFRIRDFKVVEVGSSSGGGGGTVTYTIKGLTPNTVYYITPAISDNSLSYEPKKQGTSNADGTVTVSFSSAELTNQLFSYWGKQGTVRYTPNKEELYAYSKKTYLITSATYTLTAPDDFNLWSQ